MSRRNRKPKRRHPKAPTGYPTNADRAHTAMVEAIRAKRDAERAERNAQRDTRPPETRPRDARILAMLAALLSK